MAAETMSVAQAADRFGCSRTHMYEQIKAGAVPFRVLQIGSKYRVVTSSFEAWLHGENTEVAS